MLEVRHLHVGFSTRAGYTPAVEDVSFTLPPGRTLGIVGESGSGKSVTALSILRLIPSPPGQIRQGEILFDSPSLGRVDLLTLSEKQMRHLRGNEIAMIFQEPMTSLNPVFTCGEQVVEAIRLHQRVSAKEAYERALALFEEVKLPNPKRIYEAYPHQLSGGQKQRVMIAMAISCEPRLLIADEPTTALDVTVQKTILELLLELQTRHGMSLIFISHDLGVIGEICDEVLVMYKGKVVEQGEVRAIFAHPRAAYTKGLIACRPPLDRRLHRLPTLADFLRAPERLTVEEALKAETVSEEQYRTRQKRLAAQAPLLEVENLQVHFPVTRGVFGRVVDYVKAVDGVSFTVYPGETVGLVGESGSGKTTTGRAILRLIEPTGGRVVFMDQEVTGLPSEALRRLRRYMQIIFQDPYSSLNPRLTVGTMLTEPLLFHKIVETPAQAKEKAIELLEKVGLEADHFYRYPHEFSGGQRQRIAIARALAVQPKFIICDESVSALDVSVQAQVLNLLLDLQEQYGLSYLFISHDLSVVKFMSDRLLVLYQGKVVESGYAEDIYRAPQHPYTQRLIEAIPKGRLQDIEAALARRRHARPTTATF
ncbi:MAG: ABC transporter ATP-binding protein [Bacteroidia bacterium]|nr:ABC transporter ATP-binding protein [Bacteroidia bacterium]MDW8088777.1 ABC transporter ATP-binding protein [Bacteroidia bacterium]